MSTSEVMSKALVVQCCHPPQLVFLARKLKRLHPDWRLEVLAVDRPAVREALQGCDAFDRVHWLGPGFSAEEVKVDRVVYPLLNRGFLRIKLRAGAVRGEAFEADYEGSLRPLQRRRLWVSALLCPNPATAEFAEFLKEFPSGRLGRRILMVHSADPSLIASTRRIWSQWFPEDPEITRVAGGLQWREIRLLRRRSFDSAVVFFSGERGRPRLKALPFLLGVEQILVVTEDGICFEAGRGSLAAFAWRRFWHGTARPEVKPRLLLIQTESPRYVAHGLRRLKEKGLYPDSEIVLLCREADSSHFARLPEVDRLIAYRGGSLGEKLRLFRKLRRMAPDVACAIFSGRGVFRPAKALFLLFADRPLLAFNAGLDCYFVTARTWPRLLRRDTPLYPDAVRTGTRVTLLQTEAWPYTLEALQALRNPKLYPQCRVTLICRERDRARFEGHAALERIETYDEIPRRGWIRSLWRLRRLDPEVTAAVFTGRPVFRKQKLFFWLVAGRRRLAFNARLDAYWLGLRTLPRVFRREPLLFGLEEAAPSSEALLIQTESEAVTAEALERMISHKTVPQTTVAVFCRRDSARRFASLPQVSKVYTYRPGDWRGNLKTLYRMARTDRDVTAAILSGRSVFRLQKLLFFTLPTRNRLVFNENLDCFYLARSGAARLLRLPSLAPAMRRRQSATAQGARLLLKGVLFVPRFAYLMLWLTAVKLRRVRREARRT